MFLFILNQKYLLMNESSLEEENDILNELIIKNQKKENKKIF